MTVEELTTFLRDKQVATWRKAIGIFAVIYVVWPLDLIPIIGWLDDLGVLGFCTWFFIRQVRKHAAARQALAPPQRPPPP